MGLQYGTMPHLSAEKRLQPWKRHGAKPMLFCSRLCTRRHQEPSPKITCWVTEFTPGAQSRDSAAPPTTITTALPVPLQVSR
ncbi:hypothetical protein CRUP_028833 [Coryphaenoides rupestris]|nr:hypothetical protein CRUP_028833 [Coryphaenoides rupestris]